MNELQVKDERHSTSVQDDMNELKASNELKDIQIRELKLKVKSAQQEQRNE